MPVVYHCPHCRQPVTVPDQMLGQAVTCPQCRGPFQTFAPARVALPPPPEPAEDNSFAKLDEPTSRDRRGRRVTSTRAPISVRCSAIASVLGGALVMVYNQSNRKPGQGFSVTEVLISAAVCGTCAGVGFMIGKLIEGNPSPKSRRR